MFSCGCLMICVHAPGNVRSSWVKIQTLHVRTTLLEHVWRRSPCHDLRCTYVLRSIHYTRFASTMGSRPGGAVSSTTTPPRCRYPFGPMSCSFLPVTAVFNIRSPVASTESLHMFVDSCCCSSSDPEHSCFIARIVLVHMSRHNRIDVRFIFSPTATFNNQPNRWLIFQYSPAGAIPHHSLSSFLLFLFISRRSLPRTHSLVCRVVACDNNLNMVNLWCDKQAAEKCTDENVFALCGIDEVYEDDFNQENLADINKCVCQVASGAW